METVQGFFDTLTAWVTSAFTQDIYNDTSISDLLTLETMLSLAGNVAAAFAILILGLVVSGFVGRRIRGVSGRYGNLDKTLFTFLGNIARYTILAFTALFILNTFGVRTTSVVAMIGAASLAIGLALQGTLSNVAAGVMIIIFRPLKIGDFVDVNGVMGTVQDITLNYTEIADLGNVQVVVPNSEVWGNTIKNYSGYPTRRAEWSFGVGYGANLAKAETVIRDTIMSDARSHTNPEPFIQVNELNFSSVDFLARVWCDADVYFQYQADMKRKVKEALDSNDIDIPFPTRTLRHEDQTVRLVRTGEGSDDDDAVDAE